jgi:hypothetical protein
VNAWEIQVHSTSSYGFSGSGSGGSTAGGNPLPVSDWSQVYGFTETDTGHFVESGPPGCAPPIGCPTPDYNFPGSASLLYDFRRNEELDVSHPFGPPGPCHQSSTETQSVSGSQGLDGTPGGSVFGLFKIDYRTNPPRAESDITGPNFSGQKAITFSGCLNDNSFNPSLQRNVDLGFYYSEAADDAGGDTQVRFENGQFIVQGTGSYSYTNRGCVGFFLECTQNSPDHFLPSQGQTTVDWTARPYCEPIAAADLLGANAVNVVDSMEALDGDGIPTCWKQNGIQIKRTDGTVLTVPLPGAHVGRKDLFVEADYMDCAGGGGNTCAANPHSDKPLQGVIGQVVDAFRTAPVDNPDGSTGINLHVDVGEAVPLVGRFGFPKFTNSNCPAFSFYGYKNQYFGTPADRQGPDAALVLSAKRMVYRYMIFADQQPDSYDATAGSCVSNDSSGLAELPGNDFIVTVGSWTSLGWAATDCFADETPDTCGLRQVEAATFMHELGHTLGLGHGGGDNVNCKPNYLSVMNYAFQFPDNVTNRPLSYSSGVAGTSTDDPLPALNENALDKASGVGGPAGQTTVYGIGGVLFTGPAAGPIDWTGDGTMAGVVSANPSRIDAIPACQGTWPSIDGNLISLKFIKPLNGIALPPLSAFTVAITGHPAIENPVRVSVVGGNYVLLYLAAPVSPGDSAAVSYTRPAGPGAVALTTSTGAPIGSFSQNLTNTTSGHRVLTGFDDWAHLQYNLRDTPDFASGVADLSLPSAPDDLTEADAIAIHDAILANTQTLPAPNTNAQPTTPTTAQPALSVAASGPSASKATVGTPLRLAYVVANRGPGDASAVTFSADLPAGLLAASANSSRGGCTTNGKLVCYLGDFTAGQTATITINLQLNKPGTFALAPQASAREQTVAAAALTLTALMPGGPTLKLNGGAFQRPLQTRRLGRAALLRLTLSLDEQAKLKLAVLTPNGRAVRLLPGSSLATSIAGQPTHLLQTNAAAGPITVYLRISLAALHPGATYRLILGATDANGTATTFTFPFRR